MIMILLPATTPNSFRMALLVSANTPKPIAAVMLQNKVTTPILLTISINDFFLSPLFSHDIWYLLIK